MTRRTHVLFAAMTTSLLFHPSDFKSAAIIYASSAIGSILPDIDCSTSDSHKDITIITLISITCLLILLYLDIRYNFGIINKIRSNHNYLKALVGICLIILTSSHGLHTPHRSFMHSIPISILYSMFVYLIYPALSIPFFIGYITHIILDLLNKKKIQLFYPLNFKFCFNLCESNGKTNDIFSIISIIVLILFH